MYVLENYLNKIQEDFSPGNIVRLKVVLIGKKNGQRMEPGEYEVLKTWDAGILAKDKDDYRYFVQDEDTDKMEIVK